MRGALVLHVTQALALSDQHARVGVAEVVDANLTEPCLRQQLRPDAAPEVVGVEGIADIVREDQAGTSFTPSSTSPLAVPRVVPVKSTQSTVTASGFVVTLTLLQPR